MSKNTINNYVKSFGHLSFEEKPFNNVDACILAVIVYSNWEVVAPSILYKDHKPFVLSELRDSDLPIVAVGHTFGKDNSILLELMRKSKRYSNIAVQYVNKVHNNILTNQFYACTFNIPHVGHYIAYRGTDSTLVGWKEDFDTSVRKVIPSQLDALDYINIVSTYFEGPILIGGHSKGGNLSLFTSLHIAKSIKDRVINVWTFDGNGLATKDYYDTDEYKQIKDKIIFLSPEDSVIGEIFYNPKDGVVVKSKRRGLEQHYPHNWLIDIDKGDFIYVEKRTKKARVRHKTLKLWVEQCDIDDRKLLIDFLVELCGGIDKNLNSFMDQRFKLFRIFRFHKKQSFDNRKRLRHIFVQLFKISRDVKKYYKIKDKESKKK